MQTLNDIRWSNPSTFSRTGVHHDYRTAPATVPDLDAAGASAWKEKQFGYQLVRKVWWGMLEPGGFIVPHIDKGPYWVRWHYPVEPAGYVWQWGDGAEERTQPFKIRHWEPHAVWNPTDKRRVHLIVELDEHVASAIDHSHDLELFPILDEMRDLVEAVNG